MIKGLPLHCHHKLNCKNYIHYYHYHYSVLQQQKQQLLKNIEFITYCFATIFLL